MRDTLVVDRYSMDTKLYLCEPIWLTVLKNYNFVALPSTPPASHATSLASRGVRYNECMTHSPITYSEDAPFTEQESETHAAHHAAHRAAHHAAQASNPYERARTQALTPYAAFVSNPQPGALVVVGSSPEVLANPTLRTALIASAERFSYTQGDLAWISRETQEKDTPAHLEDKALLHVIETLDPIAVIICDEDSAYACARAYRTHLDLDSATTLLIRPCACFTNLVFLLDASAGKQRAWHILKETLAAL